MLFTSLRECTVGEGSCGWPQVRSNFKNTVLQIKRLIGRKYSDPRVQYDMEHHLPFTVVPLEHDEIGIEVEYEDQKRVFTPQAVMATLLGHMKRMVEKTTETKVADVVLSVPPFFNTRQRGAMLDAAHVAGLNCLRLLNENTAVALCYGFFRQAKQPFDDAVDTRVLFIDMGHAAFNASVVSYMNKKARVLSHGSDDSLGGRDIDYALAKHMAGVFQERTGLDAWSKWKPRLKLLNAAEAAKKKLSPYGVNEAPVNVECLMDDRDLLMHVTLEDLESLIEPLVSRVEAPLRRALELSGTTPEQLSAVEIVGGSVRVRAIKRRIAQVLGRPLNEAEGHGLGASINQDEAVARGCALQCAMLSPLFRVREFHVADRVVWPVRISWDREEGVAPEGGGTNEDGEEAQGEEDATSLVLFQPGDPLPFPKRVTFRRRKPFVLRAQYDIPEDELGPSETRSLGEFQIDGFPKHVQQSETVPKVRLEISMNLHGLLEVSEATLVEKYEVEEVPTPTPAASASEKEKSDKEKTAPMEDDAKTGEGSAAGEGGETPASGEGGAASEQQGGMEDDRAEAEGDQAETPKGSESAAQENDKADTPAAAGAGAGGAEAPKKKKKTVRTPLQVRTKAVPGVLEEHIREEMRKSEHSMLAQDEHIQATQDMRNDLEAYIYRLRGDLEGPLGPYVRSEDAESTRSRLMDEEDWVCFGDGFDAGLEEVRSRLDALKQIGNPMYHRKYEAENREVVSNELLSVIQRYQDVARSSDATYDHLEDSERDTLRAAAREAETWFREKQQQQGQLETHEDPVLKIADMQAKIDNLHKECRRIANKPKPAPKPAPAPAPTPAEGAAEEEATGGAKSKEAEAKDDDEGEGEGGEAAGAPKPAEGGGEQQQHQEEASKEEAAMDEQEE